MPPRVTAAAISLFALGAADGGWAACATTPPLTPTQVPAPGSADAARYAAAGKWSHTVIDRTWHDDARNRDVPVRVYLPATDLPTSDRSTDETNAERFAVVVFSHGAGGSREGYAYVGKHLASHGYLVVLPQHAGSDSPAMRTAMQNGDPGKQEALRQRVRERLRGKAAGGPAAGADRADLARQIEEAVGGPLSQMTSDPANLENRPRDISFVLDRVASDTEFAARADMARVGVAGHSFGAYTSLAAAGLRVQVSGQPRAWPDPRVKAVVAMSPQGRGVMGIYDGSWDEVRVPVLCITGTKDMGQGQRAAGWRRDILGHIQAPTTFIEITDANHMTFAMNKDGVSDSQRLRGGTYNDEHNRLIRLSVTAFLDAQVRGDDTAKAFVEGGGLKEAVRTGASFETAGRKP